VGVDKYGTLVLEIKKVLIRGVHSPVVPQRLSGKAGKWQSVLDGLSTTSRKGSGKGKTLIDLYDNGKIRKKNVTQGAAQ